MLAYFGVFVVAPFTALVMVVVGAALLVGTLVALLGASGPLGVRLAALAALGLTGLGQRARRAVSARFDRRRIVPLWALSEGTIPQGVGPKAAGLAALHRAGLPVLPGFVVTGAARARPLPLRLLSRELTSLGAARVIVRSSFLGEDGGEGSGAGRYLTVRDVVADPKVVAEAISRVFHSAGGAVGGVIVQPMVTASALGVIATVDPRTGFRERALCQRFELDVDGCERAVTVRVVDRTAGAHDEAVAMLDRFADGRILEAEVAYTPGGVVFLQQRPIVAVPTVDTFVNGGVVAFPSQALTPVSRARYVGSGGLAARLREVLEPLGLRGPDDADVLELSGRFYLRWGAASRIVRPLRLTRALLRSPPRPSARSSYEEAVVQGARAAWLAGMFIELAARLAPVSDEVRRMLEAGVQPDGRPDSPEELADPGYGQSFPAWAVPPTPSFVLDGPWLRRWLQRWCLLRYRTWLVSRFEWRERVLALNREARAITGGVFGTPDELDRWRASLCEFARPVVHLGPSGRPIAPDASEDPSGGYGPAVAGQVRGPLSFDGETCLTGAILWVPDARSVHARWFPKLAGLIVDRAGPLSHLVLLAREARLPTILGARPSWAEGRVVALDGTTGALGDGDAVTR